MYSKTFFHDETGAVTVDWVVLTASLVGLGLAVILVVSGGINVQANAVSDVMEDEYFMFKAQNFGSTPEEMAQALGITSLNERQVRNRMNFYLNNRTEAQLQNQLNSWTNIANNPDHARNHRAEAELQMIAIAMDARDIEPR